MLGTESFKSSSYFDFSKLAVLEQPSPLDNSEQPPVIDWLTDYLGHQSKLIPALKARVLLGEARYNNLLRIPSNKYNRDPFIDALQEALDLLIYLAQLVATDTSSQAKAAFDSTILALEALYEYHQLNCGANR